MGGHLANADAYGAPVGNICTILNVLLKYVEIFLSDLLFGIVICFPKNAMHSIQFLPCHNALPVDATSPESEAPISSQSQVTLRNTTLKRALTGSWGELRIPLHLL